MLYLLWLLALGFLAVPLLPMRAVRLALGELLAADATTLAPAVSANEIALVQASFALNENLALGSLVLADFTGSAPKAGVVGDQQAGTNPVTGEQVVTILSPAGGYRYEATALTNLPQTIYGYVLTDNAGAVLLGAALLLPPVTLNAIGDFVDLGAVDMTFVLQPVA